MTNLGEIKSARKTSGQQACRPLIPSAVVRTNQSSQQGHQKLLEKRVGLAEAASQSASSHRAPELNSEVWNSAEDLFWDHMNEVENKWNILKLNDDIWAKLIYFERNRRLAKAYVSAPVLTVDGSTNGLDGFRIGLSGIDNTYRDLNSIGCLRSIGLGIKLKIDTQGNIMIRKVLPKSPSPLTDPARPELNVAGNKRPQCSIWIKEWKPNDRNNSANFDSESSCSMRKLDIADKTYSKLFDMRRFRLELERLTALGGRPRKLKQINSIDWRQCVSIISFVFNTDVGQESEPQPTNDLLRDPCWVMIINIIAIDLLKSLNENCDMSRSAIRLTNSPSITNLFQQATNPSSGRKLMASDRKQAGLRTSSSAAVLFPAAGCSSSSGSSNYSNGSTANFNNHHRPGQLERPASVAEKEPERITRQRLVSPLAQYRRFQSSQQLAGNSSNTIYTTFDMKYRNTSNLYNSSTSDYNSGSRSTSMSGYGSNWAQHSLGKQPANNNNNNNNYKYGRYQNNYGPAGYKRLSRHRLLEAALTRRYDNPMSLSNFDLSQHHQTRTRQPAGIRINYDDYLSENEDVDEEQREATAMSKLARPIQENQLVGSSVVASNYCCCNITEQIRSQLAADNSLLKSSSSGGSESKQVRPENGTEPAKASRSSIGSSSSSSGCPDHDYFLSQSSSSMSSSSAASNELFVAPSPTTLSSSETTNRTGNSSHHCLAGNTSDECQTGGCVREVAVGESGQKCRRWSSKEPVKAPRRGYNIKRLELEGEFACNHKKEPGSSLLSSSNDKLTSSTTNSDSLMDGCDCPAEPECKCECCACDCCPPGRDKVEPLPTQQQVICNCLEETETESNYNRLPHPASSPLRTTTTTTTTMTKTTTVNQKTSELEKEQKLKKRSSFLGLRKAGSVAKLNMQEPNGEGKLKIRSGSKEQLFFKQTGWLERSKYSRILPKFIFSNNRCEHDENRRQPDGSTQGAKLDPKIRSTTLDRNIRYRLTGSNFELS